MLGLDSQYKNMSNLMNIDPRISYNNRSLPSNVLLVEQGVVPHSLEGRQNKKVVQDSKIRFSTWNIGTLKDKSWEVVGVMRDRKVNILCLQETKWVRVKARDIGGYKLWYTNKVSSKNGVGIIVDE